MKLSLLLFAFLILLASVVQPVKRCNCEIQGEYYLKGVLVKKVKAPGFYQTNSNSDVQYFQGEHVQFDSIQYSAVQEPIYINK